MNNQKQAETDRHNDFLVEKLSKKVKGFAVIGKSGEVLGEVRDLFLDENRHLNFVVSQLMKHQRSRQVLLISHLIERIDYLHKSVLVTVNQVEVEDLPEFLNPEILDIETSEIEPSEVQSSPAILDSEVVEGATKDIKGIGDTSAASDNVSNNNSLLEFNKQEVLTEAIIPLLGERLAVERSKRKVSEIVVRKQIETRMVEIPVRYEKLIVEQVGTEQKRIAEIESGKETTVEFDQNKIAKSTTSQDNRLTVNGEFKSPTIPSLLLNAVFLDQRHGCKNVRVEIVVEDAEHQNNYQELFDRYSNNQIHQF